jgi:hypothetical protein
MVFRPIFAEKQISMNRNGDTILANAVGSMWYIISSSPLREFNFVEIKSIIQSQQDL